MSKPRISLNKLGEYLDATPSRRKRIILDQQEPKTFVMARYQDARQEIVNFISNGMLDDAELLNTAQELRNATNGTEFTLQDKKASADAIENFLDIADNLNLDGVIAEPVDKFDSSTLEIAGVDVTVRPDIILKDENTSEIKGAVKLHFSKTAPLTEKSANYVATGLKAYLTKKSPNIDASKCFVVDVATQTVVSAPRTHIKRMRDIEAACEEIDARWKKYDPWNDFIKESESLTDDDLKDLDSIFPQKKE